MPGLRNLSYRRRDAVHAMLHIRHSLAYSSYALRVRGRDAIRTRDSASRFPVFETGPFNHSGTLPYYIIRETRDRFRLSQKRRDSNSWHACACTCFPGKPVRPLRHPSESEEDTGFEPVRRFPAYEFSKLAPSANPPCRIIYPRTSCPRTTPRQRCRRPRTARSCSRTPLFRCGTGNRGTPPRPRRAPCRGTARRRPAS